MRIKFVQKIIDKIRKKEKKNTNEQIEFFENILYFLPDANIKRPKIFNLEETIEYLTNTDKSLARFGDGEINIINGLDIPFQKYDKELACKLKKILKNDAKNLIVGINYHFYYPTYNPLTNQFIKENLLFNVPNWRRSLSKLLDYDKQYCNADFVTFTNSLTEEFFNKFRKIWDNKDIILVTCKELLDNIQYNIFDNAKSITNIYVANKNSYFEYERVYKQIKNVQNCHLVILCAGLLSKVLAYDLSEENYRALDLGHLLKAYDFFKRKVEYNSENIIKFYQPDEEIHAN